jgi:hypothetical protein
MENGSLWVPAAIALASAKSISWEAAIVFVGFLPLSGATVFAVPSVLQGFVITTLHLLLLQNHHVYF